MIFSPGDRWYDRVGNVWEIVEIYDGGPFPIMASSGGRKNLYTAAGRFNEIGESKFDLIKKVNYSVEIELAKELEDLAEKLLETANKIRSKLNM